MTTMTASSVSGAKFSNETLRVAEVLRNAMELGPEPYRAVHAALLKVRPDIVPPELPQPNNEAIIRAVDALIKERMPATSRQTPRPPPIPRNE